MRFAKISIGWLTLLTMAEADYVGEKIPAWLHERLNHLEKLARQLQGRRP